MMKEKIIENGIQYLLYGDYYLPDLKLEPEPRLTGRWGRMHRDYLKEYRPVVFNQLVLSGNLWTHLADINEQAHRRMEVLIRQMKNTEGVTEELKEANQMEWVQRMVSIQHRAEETILSEITYE